MSITNLYTYLAKFKKLGMLKLKYSLKILLSKMLRISHTASIFDVYFFYNLMSIFEWDDILLKLNFHLQVIHANA